MNSDRLVGPSRAGRRRISVALATYNGERYLEEQLRSLVNQTLKPVELIVADDASTDGSVQMLTRFAESAPFPVSVVVRDERGGVARNFSDALSRTSGELVALCDQDDVWMPEKLEVLASAFDVPSVTASACDAELVDAEGLSLEESLWCRHGFTAQRRADFETDPFLGLLKANPISGATTLFRSDIVRRALPIPEGAIHDWWLLLIASAVGSVSLIADALVCYRQHDRNVIGALSASPVTAWQRRRRARAEPVWTEDSLFRALAGHEAVPADRRKDLDAKLALLDVRVGAGAGRLLRVVRVMRALARGDYHRYARGVSSAIVDVVDACVESPPRAP